MTQLTVGSALNIQYAYPAAGANNGKLTSQTDVISGEQITYTYDALNRLATAVTSDNPSVTQWGQSYNYDGFGNLTDQNLIKGTAPSMHVVYNASTNRQTGDSADYNGNLGSGNVYDIDNRLVQPGGGSTARYGYDAGNKRVWRGDTSSGLDEIAFWAGNQKLCTYSAAGGSFTLLTTNVYFGAKLVSQGTKNVSSGQDHVQLAPVAQDRLGSMNGKFYPYGQERPSATTSDKEKFTGYFRDASTGLDYADQRYEQPGVGRFMTPDPLDTSANANDPSTWNRYPYAGGDPANKADPSGLCSAVAGGYSESDGPCSGVAAGTWGVTGGNSTTAYGGSGCDFGCDGGDQSLGSWGGWGGCCFGSNAAWFGWDDYGAINLNEADYAAAAQRASNGGSGGDPQTAPDKSKTADPPMTKCSDNNIRGFGYGYIAGASAALGVGPNGGYAGSGTLTHGDGWFSSGSDHTLGGFSSGGASTSGPAGILNYPSNQSGSWTAAAFGGVGGGWFMTNAGNSTTLQGVFTSHILSIGPLSFELDHANGIFVFSMTGGKSMGGGITTLKTNTFRTTCK